MSRPLGSAPTSRQQGHLSYYGSVRRRVAHRYSVPSVSASARSLSSTGGPQDPMTGRRYRHPPSHVPCKTCRPGSRRLYAGHRLANRRAPARLIPGKGQESPVSMSLFKVTTLRQRRPPGHPGQALLARLPGPHLMRSSAPFPCRSPRRSSANAAQGGLTPAPAGRRRRAIPPSLAQHRFQRNSYMAPPSAFVTHCPALP
jgi:hypothetical protein